MGAPGSDPFPWLPIVIVLVVLAAVLVIVSL